MLKNKSLPLIISVVSLVIACVKIFSPTIDTSDLKIAKEFREALSMCIEIESETCQEYSPTQVENMILLFAKKFRSSICQSYSNSVLKVKNEFAIETDSLIKTYGKHEFHDHIDRMMKIGDFDPYLKMTTEQYQDQLEHGEISSADIICNIVRFQVTNLHAVMFVMQTDIKYLLIAEDQVGLNKAIEEEVESGRSQVSCEKMSNKHRLTAIQHGLLERFYIENQALGNTWYETVGRFSKIGIYTVGKLIESCQTVIDHQTKLKDLKSAQNDACVKSQMNSNSEFSRVYRFDQYDSVFNFCQDLMNTI